MATAVISGTVTVGTVAQDGATIYAWKASRFSGIPAENAAPPSGSADAGPVTSGPSFGGEGAFQIVVPTTENYYLQIIVGSTTAWYLYPLSAGGAVSSVFGRTGAVIGVAGDYTVSQVTGAAPLASPTFTGTVTVPASVNATDAAQKADLLNWDWKQAVAACATGNQPLTGLVTIDGYATSPGDRVLCTGQTTGSQNGVWVVGSGAWTRPTDFASGSFQDAVVVAVQSGTARNSTIWILSGSGGITVDTNSETWVNIVSSGGSGSYTAAEGTLPGTPYTTVTATSYTLAPTVGPFPYSALVLAPSTGNNVALTMPSGLTSGVPYIMTVELKQDATGGRTVTWPGSVSWPGEAPELSTGPNAVDIVRLRTIDGGTSWIGLGPGVLTTTAQSAAYTAVPNDVVLLNTAGGAVTVTLPSMPPAGSIVWIKKTSNDTNTVSVATQNSATIDGAASPYTFTQYQWAHLFIFDGANWSRLSRRGVSNITGSNTISVAGTNDVPVLSVILDATAADITASAPGDAKAAGSVGLPADSGHRHGREGFGTPGSSAVGDTAAPGSAATISHSDHTHGREAFATPGSSAVGDAAAAGTATTIPRSDHKHGRESFATPPFGVAAAPAAGSAATIPHSDHVHGVPIWLPADNNLSLAPFAPELASNAAGTLAAGTIVAIRVRAATGDAITKFWYAVGTAAATYSSGVSFLALWDSSGNCLASTGDIHATFANAATPLSAGIAYNGAGGSISSYTLTAGATYWIGGCSATYSTMPALQRAISSASFPNLNLAAGLTGRFQTFNTGVTSLASNTVPALTGGANSSALWFGAST